MLKTALIGLGLSLLATLPSQADPTLDKIKSAGKITVATEAAFEPFEFTKDGKIVGYGSDILAEVVKDLNVKLEQLDIPFQGILAGLEAGQYDFVATTVAINPERAKKYAFTRPIGAVENVVLVQSTEKVITKPEDLAGKIVGTQLGSSTEGVARDYEKKLSAKYRDLRLFQTFPDTAFQLASGQVDAIVISSPTAATFLKSQPGKFKVIGRIGDPVYVAWVTRPADKDLRTSINKTLARLVDSGELKKMQEKWLGLEMPTPASGYLPEGAMN